MLEQPEDYASPELTRVITVSELREALAPLPGDAPIFVDGYEGGLDRPFLASTQLRTLVPYAELRCGGLTGPWRAGPGDIQCYVLHRQD